jgi:hypothetical protein
VVAIASAVNFKTQTHAKEVKFSTDNHRNGFSRFQIVNILKGFKLPSFMDAADKK